MSVNPSSPSDRSLGAQLGDIIGGRYQLSRVLGVGGTGAVFEARHLTLGRLVAIKVLLPELGLNPIVAKRFLQEAQTSNAVRNKHIVEVIDFGDDHGRLFMVMELLQGQSLASLIRREAPMSPAAVIGLLDPVMGALQSAHEQGIVHRDVKPQNIFVVESADEAPWAKLIDFGIAKKIVDDDTQLTATGMILGTPAYMSPEQAQGARNVGAAADQYAFGAIVFQALAGQIPHQADTYPAMLIAIVTTAPPALSSLRPDLPPALCEVVMRALAREPAQRFASLGAFREALRPFAGLEALPSGGAPRGLEGPPRPSTPPNARTRPDGTAEPSMPFGGPPAVAPRPPVSVETPAPQAPRSHLGRVAAAVGALALGSALFAVGVVVRRAAPPAPETQLTITTLPTTGDTAAESVTFRVDVEPPTATIELDGAMLGRGHAEVLKPRDGRRYQLRLAAPDHADVTEVLVASTDARISRVLVALAQPAPSAPPSEHTHTTRVPGVTAPAPNVPSEPRPGGHPSEGHRPGSHHPRIERENPFQ
ncbi:MAG: protein kinase [Myxococcales bacterium]|nr:protein kinase [Myxococcales bacterium]